MKESVKLILDNLVDRYPVLSGNVSSITEAYELLQSVYKRGSKLLLCGNGGSDADCNHIVGELMKGFILQRKLDVDDPVRLSCPEIADDLQYGLPAISLCAHSALMSAFSNDVSPENVFAQQVMGYYRPGDVLIGLSTSGNSRNVVKAFKVMKAMGGKTIAFTGQGGGVLGDIGDVVIAVPETETYKIQELHLPIYHCLCMMLEQDLFGERS